MTQSTLSVLDSGGVPRIINTANSNGQAASVDSAPVVLASDQTLPLPVGAATDSNLTSIGNANHADLQTLTSSQHADLSAILTKLVVGAATDANLLTIGNINHTDLQALLTAIGTTNSGLTTLTTTQHTDLTALLSKMVSGASTDANLTTIGNVNHTDLLAILAKIVPGAATDSNLTTIGSAAHADMVALLAKSAVLPTGSSETNRTATTVANTAIQLMAANASRKYFELQNLDSSVTLYFRKDSNAAGVNAPGTFALTPGGFYSGQSTGAVSIISTIAGHAFTAVEA